MAYIDQHKHRFEVEPICAALRAEGIAVAPSGYYAHKKRTPSRRTLRDAGLAETIEATFFDRDKGRSLYGGPLRCAQDVASAPAAMASPARRAGRWRAARWSG